MRRLILILAAAVLGAGEARAQITEEALLDSLQRTAFQFFWREANPANGMVKDRSTPTSVASIASVGFGLSAITVGIDHGWITREQGRQRVRTTLETFWNGPQGTAASGTIGYKGLFYHWLDMNTATRTWDSELSSVDTALLLAGILDARQYFTQSDTNEVRIRALADSINRRVDWVFMMNLGPGIRMGWKPGTGFSGFGTWVGYNEAMIMYILALGSPTFPVPTSAWGTWVSGYNAQWQTHYGYTYLTFPPLFGHQYSHGWIDYRDIQDAFMRQKGSTYFQNSRKATLAQRAYSIANPNAWPGYSDSLWGITASDDPFGYSARGAPPVQNDNGTLVPTAALSSIPFAPAECIQVARTLWNNYRPQLWGPYGFRDAFNLEFGWFGPAYIGIDQGPIALMIENHLSGAIWQRFMQCPEVQTGLTRANFQPLTPTAVLDPEGRDEPLLAWSAPNPFRRSATVRYRLPRAAETRLELYDVNGRRVSVLADGPHAAGEHAATVDGSGLASGVYWYRLEAAGRVRTGRLVRMD
jgi:hypothetical protein